MAASLTSVNPTNGFTHGGYTVTLTGTGFTGSTAVNFGGTAATALVVVSSTTITVTAPAKAEGYSDVTVLNPSGNSTLTSGFVFNEWSQTTVSGEDPLLLDGYYDGTNVIPLVYSDVVRGTAPVFVNNVGNPAGISSSTLTLTMTTTHSVPTGNSILIAIAINGGPAITITDTVGNKYSLDNNAQTGVVTSAYIFSSHKITALPSGSTITATFDTARTSGSMQAYDVSGLSGVVEDVSAGTASTATSLIQGSLQTKKGNAFTFSAYAISSNNTAQTFTAGSGYTAMAYSRGGNGSSSRDLFTEYELLSTYGYRNPSASVAISHAFAGVTVSYRAAYTGYGNGQVGPAPTPQTRNVSTAEELQTAMNVANPGDTIVMAASTTFTGSFTAPNRKGTATNPITLTGPSTTIVDGAAGTGYCIALFRCSYWHVTGGFKVRNNLKGVMLDISDHCDIDGLEIYNIKQEGLHVRNDSTYNTIRNNTIHDTGTQDPGFGEGMYVGSAVSNWGSIGAPKSRVPDAQVGFPDKSDHNSFLNNNVYNVPAECIDVKEGTFGTIIQGNTWNGSMILGANSAVQWVDIKGESCLVKNNVGTTIITNGYSTAFPDIPSVFKSAYVDGYGNIQPGIILGSNNTFDGNTINGGSATGYGVEVRFVENVGNVVYDNNTQTGMALGLTNIATTPAP